MNCLRRELMILQRLMDVIAKCCDILLAQYDIFRHDASMYIAVVDYGYLHSFKN